MQQPPSAPSSSPANLQQIALIEKILKEYTCIITDEIIFDPVKAEDGRTYEKEALEEHIKKSKEAIAEHIEKHKEPPPRLLTPHRKETSGIFIFDVDAKNIIGYILTSYPEYWENVYITKLSIEKIADKILAKKYDALPELIKQYNPYVLLKKHTENNSETFLEKICAEAPRDILKQIIQISVAKIKHFIFNFYKINGAKLFEIMVAHQNTENIKLIADLMGWQNSFYLEQGYVALKSHQYSTLTACLDLGALDNSTEDQHKFLRTAVRECSPEILKILIDKIKFNNQDKILILSALLLDALETNHDGMVLYLLAEGADPLGLNTNLPSAVARAIKNGSKNILNLFASKIGTQQLLKLLCSPPFDATDVITVGQLLGWDNEFYQTQAWEAVLKNDLNTLGICCLMGINVNRKKGKQKDKQKNKLYRGATLLHLAILQQFEAGAELLVQAGASLGIKDRKRMTPPQLALSQPKTSNYFFLMQQSQPVDESNPHQTADRKQSSNTTEGFLQNINATLITRHSSSPSLPVYAVRSAKNKRSLRDINPDTERLTFIETLRGLMIMGRNRESRLLAIRLLNRLNFKAPFFHCDLMTSLEDQDSEVCYEAARGLGQLASDSESERKKIIIRSLLDAAANRDPRYKRHIIMYALGQSNATDCETIETLKQSLSSEVIEVQLEAATALYIVLAKYEKSLGIQFSESFLLTLLKSPHSIIRGLIITHCGSHTDGLKILIGHLTEALDTHKETPENIYKINALLSTHILCSPEVMNSLMPKLHNYKEKLISLLLNLSEDNPEIHRNILNLLRKLDRYSDFIKSLIRIAANGQAQPVQRINALYALGEEPLQIKYVMLILPILDDHNYDVSKAAFIILNKFKNCLGIAAQQSLESAKFKWADILAASVFDNKQTLSPIQKCMNAIHAMCRLGINEQPIFQFFFTRVNQTFNKESYFKIIIQFTDRSAIEKSITCLFQTDKEKQQIAAEANKVLAQHDRSTHVGAIHILRALNTPLIRDPLESIFQVKTHPAHYYAAIALTEKGCSTPETIAVLFDIFDCQITALYEDAVIALTLENVFTWQIAHKLISHLSKDLLNNIRAWDHIISAVCTLDKLDAEVEEDEISNLSKEVAHTPSLNMTR